MIILVMVHPSQDQDVVAVLEEENAPVIGSSTENHRTRVAGSRSHSRVISRSRGRKARGHSRRIELERYVNAHGRIHIEIDEKIGKPVCAQATKFSGAIGTITRDTIPLRYKTWSEVPKQVRDGIKDRLSTYFIVDLSKDHINRYVERQISNTFKEYRAELYKYYCEFDDPKEAREYPPERIDDPADWNMLCDRWETPEWKTKTVKNKQSRANLPYNHRTGSKSFVQVQNELKIQKGHDVGQVDLFHESHFSIKDGWVNDNARDAYLEMQQLLDTSSQEGSDPILEPDVCKKVLGTRSGHIKGLGWDPKPSSSSSVTSSSQHEKELEKKVEQMQAEIGSLTTKLSSWEERWVEFTKYMDGRQREGSSNP